LNLGEEILYFLIFNFFTRLGRLVRVCKSAHAAHDAEHVVVDGVDADLGRALRADRVDRERQVERGLVDTREVARAAGLVLLGLEREGVHVNTRGRRAGVVLPRLHLVEVATLALVEAVLTVELDLGDLDRVLALALDVRGEDDLGEQVVRRTLEEGVILRHTAAVVDLRTRRETGARRCAETREVCGGVVGNTGCRARRGARTGRHVPDREIGRIRRAARGERAAAEHCRDDALRRPVVRVVERLLSERLGNPRRRRGVAVDERVALDDPDKFLRGVVEVHLDLVRGRRDRLVARELELVNQVLVRLLGEAAALLRVQVDVVDVDRRGDQLELRDRRHAVAEVDAGSGLRGENRERRRGAVGIAAVVVLLELDVDAYLVVLEGDERDRKTRVAAVPELQRDVQRLDGRARARQARVRGLRGGARRVQGDTAAVLEEHKVGTVAHHVVEGHLGAEGLRELRPDLHPVTILAVDARPANLDLDLLDEAVTDIVEPAEAVAGVEERDLRQRDLDVRAVHQIGVTRDDGSDAATKVGLSVERHLDRLHREVRVALVQHLPEGNLGVAGDINVLCTIRDKLHKTTTHICLSYRETIFWAGFIDARPTSIK
jgi:hypothetical protein